MEQAASKPKPLIVYYSRSGKTRMVAEKLAALLAAEAEEIHEAKDRSGPRGWLGGVRDAVMKRPVELVSRHSTQGRDVVILGTPVWANGPAPALGEYIRSVDLAGRKVAAFCTYDGSGAKATFAKLTKLLGAELLETLALKKPKAGDPGLDAKLAEWAGRCTG